MALTARISNVTQKLRYSTMPMLEARKDLGDNYFTSGLESYLLHPDIVYHQAVFSYTSVIQRIQANDPRY